LGCAARAIAQRDKTTVAALIGQINLVRNNSNLSSAVRVFVLKQSGSVADQKQRQPIFKTLRHKRGATSDDGQKLARLFLATGHN
jgi:predicted DNA-binding ribbon-helix-helix protein